MMRSISWPTFIEWMEYYSLEPFGEVREDWRFASLMALIANMIPRKDKTTFKAKDFLLKFTQFQPGKFKTQTWQQQKAIAIAIVNAWNHSIETRQAAH